MPLTEKEIRENLSPDHTVFCIENDCDKMVQLRDAIFGGSMSDWYCSEKCMKLDKLKHPNGD